MVFFFLSFKRRGVVPTTSVHADNLNKIRIFNIRNKTVKRNVCDTVLIFCVYSVRTNDPLGFIARAPFIYFVFIPASPPPPPRHRALRNIRTIATRVIRWFLFFHPLPAEKHDSTTVYRKRTRLAATLLLREHAGDHSNKRFSIDHRGNRRSSRGARD